MTKPEYETVRADELKAGDKLSDSRIVKEIRLETRVGPYIEIYFENSAYFAAPYWTYEIEKRNV